MWVYQSTWAYFATLNAVSADPAIHMELQAEALRTKNKARVHASYAAWKFAYRALYPRVYGPRGGKTPYGKTANFSAIRAITRELNFIETHPALDGEAMFGLHTTIIPAWKQEPTSRNPHKYSPYPLPGHQFVVLTPTWKKSQPKFAAMNPEFTWWSEHATGEGRLASEEFQLSLWRDGVR